MTRTWKTWITAGSVSLAALFSYVQISGTDEDDKVEAKNNTPSLHGGVASNPFIVSSTLHTEERAVAANPNNNRHAEAAAPIDEKTEAMRKEALFFLDKYKKATTTLEKFNTLGLMLSSFNRDIKHAHLIGMQPAQFARLVRDSAYQALPEITAQQPTTDLDRMIRANLIRIAVNNISLMDDGTYNDTYGAQMSGVDAKKNNDEKIGLAFSAGQESATALRAATDPRKLSDEQLSHYMNLINIVLYVELSDEVSGPGLDRIERLEKIGLTHEKLHELKTQIVNPLTTEMQRRIDEVASRTAIPNQSNQTNPMLPRSTPS